MTIIKLWLIANEIALLYFLRSSQITNPNPANVNEMTPIQSRHSSGVMS